MLNTIFRVECIVQGEDMYAQSASFKHLEIPALCATTAPFSPAARRETKSRTGSVFSVHSVGDLLREYGNSHLQAPPSVPVKRDVGLAQVYRLLSTRYKCVCVREIYTWHRLDSKAAKAWAYERTHSPVVRTEQIPWRLNSSC